MNFYPPILGLVLCVIQLIVNGINVVFTVGFDIGRWFLNHELRPNN